MPHNVMDVPGDAVRREDPRSFAIERMVREWARTIRTAAARYGIGGDDLDEIAQDVRVRLWRALEHRDRSGSDLTAAYAYRAASSAAVDMLRRRRLEQRPGRQTLEAAESVIAGPDVALTEADLIRRLELALERVSVTRRPAVRLHLEGHHLTEIAKVLNCTPASARNRLYRGLEDLKAALQEDGNADDRK